MALPGLRSMGYDGPGKEIGACGGIFYKQSKIGNNLSFFFMTKIPLSTR